MLEESCDELPTSLVYMDTSATPHKVIGHVLVEKSDDYKNAVEFDLGKCNLICLSNKVITDLQKSKKDEYFRIVNNISFIQLQIVIKTAF